MRTLKKLAAKKYKLKKSKASKNKIVKKAKKKTYTHLPDHYNTSESYLTNNLNEDLKDAWLKIREYGESLGIQRIYASGRAIMFSNKVCCFFVRPKKTYLELVVILREQNEDGIFKTITEASKTKWAHTFKLIHADQIEGQLAEAIALSVKEVPLIKKIE